MLSTTVRSENEPCWRAEEGRPPVNVAQSMPPLRQSNPSSKTICDAFQELGVAAEDMDLDGKSIRWHALRNHCRYTPPTKNNRTNLAAKLELAQASWAKVTSKVKETGYGKRVGELPA